MTQSGHAEKSIPKILTLPMMTIRPLIVSILLAQGVASCGGERYSGYEDTEFGQNFSESKDDVLASERAKAMSSSTRQFIASMDRLSKEYAVCGIYFGIAAHQTEKGQTPLDGSALNNHEYAKLKRAAWELLDLTTNVGRSEDTYMSIALARNNEASRITFRYMDDTTPMPWSEAFRLYDQRCRVLTENIPEELSLMLSDTEFPMPTSHQPDD